MPGEKQNNPGEEGPKLNYPEFSEAQLREDGRARIEEEQSRLKQLTETYLEAERKGDRAAKISVMIEWTKDFLARVYDVDNLSTAEGVHLRNVIEDMLPQYEREQELIKEGKMQKRLDFNPSEEAAVRWLYDLYGVHADKIPRTFTVFDHTDGQKYDFDARRDQVEEKVKELKENGHSVSVGSKVTDDAKEFIKFLRRKAQHEVFE